MPDTNSILKYLKVKALAERGSPGERTAAQAALNRLEAKHPGIRQAAAAYVQQQQGGGKAPHNPFNTGNWENLFSFAQHFAQQAYGFAQQAASAQLGAYLASTVEPYARFTRAGRFVLGLKIDPNTFHQLAHLNALQKQVFKQAVMQMVEEKLQELLDEL